MREIAHSSLSRRLKDRLRSVCIALAAQDADKLFARAAAHLAQSSFLELRFDALGDPAGSAELLRAFCKHFPQAAVLATCRRIAGGGTFLGSVEEQLALLLRFAACGAALVDLELETLAAAAPDDLRRFGAALAETGAALVVSAHDFTGTADLEGTLGTLRKLGAPTGAAIYKVVSTAQKLADNLAMVRFLKEHSPEIPLVGMCMGPQGLPSRVLAVQGGALWTFAAGDDDEGTAPGQVSSRLMIDQYRAGSITPTTRVYGVAGNPVAHSLSPPLHNAAFRAAGVDAVYLPLHTTSMGDLLEFTRGLPLHGLSVTMPWKVEILPHLDEVDPLARAIGAVNTVVRRSDGSLWGTNTDAAAITEPLGARLPLRGAQVLLLGAGGAARAAAFALGREGADVTILNRTYAAAGRLAYETGAIAAEEVRGRRFDAVVNATPAGMVGPFAGSLPLDLTTVRGVQVVFEMIYRPAETPLVRQARSLGIEVIRGLEMFLHQGMRQWVLWTGQQAPEPAMRSALHAALSREQHEGEKDGKVRRGGPIDATSDGKSGSGEA